MRKNKKVLKVTTSLLSGIFLASSITGNIYANNKVSFVEIMPNNEDIYFAVEEKGEDLVNIKLSAKKDVENISLKFVIDNKQYFYNYKSLKKGQEISLDVNTKELAKKILPVTSVVRKTEEINAVVGNHIIKGTISYSVNEENDNKENPIINDNTIKDTKEDKDTSDNTKVENEKPKLDKEVKPEENKEGKVTPEVKKEETKTEKETSELNREQDSISIVVKKGAEPLANSDVRLIKKENNIPNIYGTFKTNDKGMLKFDKLEKNSEYEIWMANTTYKYDKDFVTVVTDDRGNIKSVDGALATTENTTIEFTAYEKQEVSDSIKKVTFKVVNKETGLPEENVQLTANTIHPKLASYKHVKSDKDGNVTFELEGTEEGKIYTICISKNYQFLYDFEPEEITIVVTNKDVVLANANEAIFKVTKNDRSYLKENLKNKIKEAEEFIAKNPKLYTQKLQQLVDKSKEELEKETIPLYVEGYTKQITDKLNELKNTSETPLENEPIIYHVRDENKTLEVGNSEFTTRVFGKNLTDDLKIFVKELVDNQEIDNTDVTLKGVSGEKSGFKDVVLVAKENKTNADKVYKVYYGYGDNASNVSSEIIVKPSVSNEVTKVVIPTILLNYNNDLVLEPVTFKIMEKDGGKSKEITSVMSMLTEIEVEKNKEYTISLNSNDKYTMVPLSFVVDNDNGEPKIVGSNDTLVQLDLSKKILTPIINDYSINNDILNSSGGKVTVAITGENLKYSDYGTRVRVIDIDTSAENSDITKGIVYREEGNRLFADINFPGNTSNKTKSYSLTIYSNLNQVFNKSGNRSQRAVISVLPANASNTDITLSNLTINSYATNSTGALSDGVNPKHTVTATNQESKKTEVKLYGTNLKESVTKIRIFDTNGVEWPIFVAGSTLSGIYPKMILPGTSGIGNGIVGNGNFQLLEVILPNELSTDMTYSYYISIDGSGNLVEDNKVTATVKAGSATSEKVNPEKRTITIKYQDEHGRKLKDDKTIVGYSWFYYTVEKDNIENYSFKNVKDNLNLTGKFGTEDKEIILVYGDKTSVVDENLATAEDKEKLNTIKNTKPADIPNFREASEELRRLHALARLEATELLAKDNATKEEVNNLINKLQDIRNKIEKSGKVESNEPTVENSGVATEETAEKDIEFYKDELRKIAVILSKIDNYSEAEESLKLEYTQKRKEALKKLGNNEFTLEEIKNTIEELKILKGKIENSN
ncbi:MucBP domain-containing protein [Gemelliphila palaticanis]|uniref:MucBP domain-containing protein n=1 Tax=Gemelliphila palaticanis TaxID=81950 RepID=A0ABX2SXN2_9BACL|nr:MucBP domain-containing protein [Gemella palaticanis]MBF0714783.1 MucBP domain-containing protein [Gemella palaticanis]NYS46713.1 MucBP domain-containing protein [Gemella palaticanis]